MWRTKGSRLDGNTSRGTVDTCGTRERIGWPIWVGMRRQKGGKLEVRREGRELKWEKLARDMEEEGDHSTHKNNEWSGRHLRRKGGWRVSA